MEIPRIPGAEGIGAGRIRDATPDTTPFVTGPAGGIAASFRETLAVAGREQGLELSSHALKRLEQRGVDLQDDQLGRLRKAMDSLAERGGRTSLVMLDQVAYVVHIPTHTVVTAVSSEDGKEAVFTQIDSVAIA
jgi:flagellar operon protein